MSQLTSSSGAGLRRQICHFLDLNRSRHVSRDPCIHFEGSSISAGRSVAALETLSGPSCVRNPPRRGHSKAQAQQKTRRCSTVIQLRTRASRRVPPTEPEMISHHAHLTDRRVSSFQVYLMAQSHSNLNVGEYDSCHRFDENPPRRGYHNLLNLCLSDGYGSRSGYSGMFPCFFRGIVSTFVSSIPQRLITLGRSRAARSRRR